MRPATSHRAVLTLACLLWAGPATLAVAAPMTFQVPLTGAQEVPPVQTAGSGTANLSYDPTTRGVSWTITFSGLSTPATMAHIHGPATPGKNAGVQVWLSQKGASSVSSPIQGQATLTPAEAKELMAGQMYINVHTKAHPGGAIRGQVMPPKSS